MFELKDSGERRVFESGAERDISEGKGRCDLLPLDSIALLFASKEIKRILSLIEKFKQSKDADDLARAIEMFGLAKEVPIQTIILEVSLHYEDGAKKYAPNNWMKGMPLHCYIDSGVRHLLKYCRGDKDEPHDRAFVWNMLGAIWTIEHLPELDDIEIPTIGLPIKDDSAFCIRSKQDPMAPHWGPSAP